MRSRISYIEKVIIHTLDARNNVHLTVIRYHFDLDAKEVRKLILQQHEILVDGLSDFGVDYSLLSPALVPSSGKDRHDAAFLFDAQLLEKLYYNYAIAAAKLIIPLLDRKSTHSFLIGDVRYENGRHTLDLAKNSGLLLVRDPGFTDIFCVYINNLSNGQLNRLHIELAKSDSYIGYVPADYDSSFRRLLVGSVGSRFIKNKKSFIGPSESSDDEFGTDNPMRWPFEEYEYSVVSVPSDLYNLFLRYKIELRSDLLPDDDIQMSLNSISDYPVRLIDLDVEISPEKLRYLKSEKSELLRLAELENLSADDLSREIKMKLTSNYLYKMKYNPDSTVQFSILLEFVRAGGSPIRLNAGLKYYPLEKKLTLVTMT